MNWWQKVYSQCSLLSVQVQMPVERKQSSFSTNRIPVKLRREVTLLLRKSISFQFHFCQFLRKIGTVHEVPFGSFIVTGAILKILALILFKVRLRSWASELTPVFVYFCFFCGFCKISWKVLDEYDCRKKAHRKKHGMDFSSV